MWTQSRSTTPPKSADIIINFLCRSVDFHYFSKKIVCFNFVIVSFNVFCSFVNANLAHISMILQSAIYHSRLHFESYYRVFFLYIHFVNITFNDVKRRSAFYASHNAPQKTLAEPYLATLN